MQSPEAPIYHTMRKFYKLKTTIFMLLNTLLCVEAGASNSGNDHYYIATTRPTGFGTYLTADRDGSLTRTDSASDYSKWDVIANSDGSYYIKNVETSTYLDGTSLSSSPQKVYLFDNNSLGFNGKGISTSNSSTSSNFLNCSTYSNRLLTYSNDDGSCWLFLSDLNGDDAPRTVDGLKYVPIDANTCVLVGYDDVTSTLDVPAVVNMNGTPHKVLTIGPAAFSTCTALTAVTIPEGMTSIEYCSFEQCDNLTDVTLPKTLTRLGHSAFFRCANIDNVICKAATPPTCDVNPYTGISVFSGGVSQSGATLQVPEGSRSSYMSHSVWGKFGTIIEFEAEPEPEPTPMLNVQISGDGEILLAGKEVESGSSFEGESFDIIILPADGYVIESVTLDGVDAAGRIANHHLVLDGIESETTLSIVFAPAKAPEMATLRVNNGGNHAMTHRYVAGSDVRIELHPDNGWTIHSVSINGEDATDTLRDKVLVIPSLQGDNTMEVVYKSGSETGIDDVDSGDSLRVSIRRGVVSVVGKADGDIVEIYDIDGKPLYVGTDSSINLNNVQGVVIVKVRNQTFKGAVR